MRRTLGDEHEHTLVSVAALGALYTAMGDCAAALPLCEEALEARKRTLGDDHLETMNSAHILGRCLVGLGRRHAGLLRLEQAEAAAVRVLGEKHPSTQHFAATLASARVEGVGLDQSEPAAVAAPADYSDGSEVR
jgi:hypothetical protein